MMAFLQQMRSPRLSFIQTVLSLFLGGTALMSSYWCVGQQKVPKPLCTATKHTNCIPVPGVSNSSNIQFFWETGDDCFVFPVFHTGLFIICEENIYTDTWETLHFPANHSVRAMMAAGVALVCGLVTTVRGCLHLMSLNVVFTNRNLRILLSDTLYLYSKEKCRGFHTLTPGSEKAMMWLSLTLELMYIGLLLISCTLLSVQLCIRTCCPSTQRWGQLLNAFAAVFTVLGGLLGMVGHMMFMQVFQTTVSMGPEDFKPHSYGYSWAFYVAWLAFTVCMSAGVSTLNNYTKKVLMVGPRRTSGLNACSFNFVGLLPPYYNPATPLACPPSPPRISHLSPYYEPPSAALPASTPRLTHSNSLPPPLSHSDSFPPPPPHPAPASPFHRLSLPSPSPLHMTLPGHQEDHYDAEEDYSPL